jgi:hypothetical protein
LFLGWLLVFAGHHQALFGLNGWFDQEAYLEASRLRAQLELGAQQQLRAQRQSSSMRAELPASMSDEMEAPVSAELPVPIDWSLLYLCGSDPTLLNFAYWGSLAVLVFFTLGLWTRVTAVLTWLIVVSFHANPATRFEADYLLVIVAFYLMIGYLFLGLWNGQLSLAERLLGPADTFLLGRWLGGPKTEQAKASHAANLAVRLLQIHFVLIVVVSGLHKLQMAAWWSGVALWYPLHPPFKATLESILAEVPARKLTLTLLGLAQYLVLAWQLGFPLFAWRKGYWRLLLLGGGVISWIGSFFLLGLPLFGPVYLLGCLSYLTPAEWLWLPEQMAAPPNGLAVSAPAAPSKLKEKARV